VLEIGIEALLRVQFWAIAGQIEDLDFVLALSYQSSRFGV